ncbi:MAG: head GIN domain-containing protein [Ferruginibacter sp.]
MKYLLLLAIIFSSAACRYNSRKGSGKIISEKRTTENFVAINADGPVHVEIQKGATVSVTVETDDNIMPFVETKVSGSTLKIRLKEINRLRNSKIRVFITAPELKELNSSASAEIESKDIITTSGNMEMQASSGSKIDVALEAPSVTAETSSGADIIARGRTKNFTATAGSGSSVKAGDLLAENATGEAGSGASVKMFGSLSINANAGSGGKVTYTGGATQVKKNESSGGSVREY